MTLQNEVVRKKEDCKHRNKKHFKNTKCGEIELYYFNGQPANSIYRIDDIIIMVSVKNSSEKSIHLPYFIFRDNGEGGMYRILNEEISAIINDSTKVIPLSQEN